LTVNGIIQKNRIPYGWVRGETAVGDEINIASIGEKPYRDFWGR